MNLLTRVLSFPVTIWGDNHPYILSNIWTGSTDGDYPVVEQHPVRDEVGQTPDNDGASQHVDDAVLETVSRVIYGNVQWNVYGNVQLTLFIFVCIQLRWGADLQLRGQVSPTLPLARVGGGLVVEDAGHRHHNHLGDCSNNIINQWIKYVVKHKSAKLSCCMLQDMTNACPTLWYIGLLRRQ